MKQSIKQPGMKTIFASLMGVCCQLAAFAQDSSPKVEVNNTDVGTWIGNNWIWVAVAVVVLLILLLSSGNRVTKVTKTTVQKNDGRVISSTTTETD